jgi:hypothetical protein
MFQLFLTIIVAAAAAATAITLVQCAPGNWMTEISGTFSLPPQAPTGREDFGMSCTSGYGSDNLKLWVVGGRDKTGPLEAMYSFDLAQSKWTRGNSDGFVSDVISFHLLAFEMGGEQQLLRFCGREYSTNDPSNLVQIYDQAWKTISATDPNTPLAEDVSGYYFGTWSPRLGQIGAGLQGAFVHSGITDAGFSRQTRLIAFNQSQGVRSAMWRMANIPLSAGTAGVNFPRPLYGHCCARCILLRWSKLPGRHQ